MRKFTRRMLSLFLSFLMVLSSLTVGLTAFAKSSDWNKGALDTTYGDISEYIDAIAHALYGNADSTSMFSTIAYTNEPYFSQHYYNAKDSAVQDRFGNLNIETGLRGNILVDNENGDMLTAVENAWQLLMNIYGLANRSGVGSTQKNVNTKLDTAYNDFLIKQLQNYMGSDFLSTWENVSPYLIAHWFGTGNEWPDGRRKANNVLIVLDPEYYLFKQCGNSIYGLPNDIIPVVRSYWWNSQNTADNEGSFLRPNYVYHRVYDYMTNQVYRAIRVNSEELKAFADLFTDVWENFSKGNFDKIGAETQMDIFLNGEKLYNDIWNADHEATYDSIREKENDGNPIAKSQTIHSNTDPASMEATQKVYERYFGEKDNFNTYFADFVEYMIKRFEEAVVEVGTTLFSESHINSDMTLDELRGVKSLIDNAYAIWEGFPDSIKERHEASDWKKVLDDYYFKSGDSATDPQAFVGLWNNKVAQAYIDVTEQLEYCSDTYNKTAPEDKKYVIERERDARNIKSLLDEADSLYADLLWEDTYENAKAKDSSPEYTDLNKLSLNLQFDSIGEDLLDDEDHKADNKVYTGATEDGKSKAMQWAREVHRGDSNTYSAQVTYDRYVLRRFLAVAEENLGEYLQGDSVVIPPLTTLDIVPVRSKIKRVERYYDQLPERFKSREDVQRYMRVIWDYLNPALERVLNPPKHEN